MLTAPRLRKLAEQERGGRRTQRQESLDLTAESALVMPADGGWSPAQGPRSSRAIQTPRPENSLGSFSRAFQATINMQPEQQECLT